MKTGQLIQTLNATVLLVEDNELNRDMLGRRLVKKGFQVIEALNGEEIFELIKQNRPDVILMDLSLPKMDGWEATRRLKESALTRDIPVIVLTAHALKTDREGAFETGCDDFDVKPIEFQRLLGKMERQLLKTL